MKKILAFLTKLSESKIHYDIHHHRNDGLLVSISVPGERWEVEFLADGSVDVEIFRSNGEIFNESSLERLFNEFSD